jgi:hypothetical protein
MRRAIFALLVALLALDISVIALAISVTAAHSQSYYR